MLTDRQVAATFLAAGQKGVEMPDVDTAISLFYEHLTAEPKRLAGDEVVLREALGLTHAG